MQKSADPNSKYYFEKVANPLKGEELSRALGEGTKVSIWCQGEDEKKVEQFETLSFDAENLTVVLKSTGGLLSSLTGSPHKDKDVLFKCPFAGGKIHFFTHGFLSYNLDDDIYQFQFKHDVFKSQQRANYRLKASDYIRVKIRLEPEGAVFKALDISAGGTSFKIPADEKDRFEKEAIFQGGTLYFNEKEFQIPTCKVAGTWEIPTAEDEESLMGIGVAFVDLPKIIEEDLFKHINGEARMEEIKKNLKAKKKSQS